MVITIWYFARIKEALDCAQERLPVPEEVETIADLQEHLAGRGESWRKTLLDDKVLVAVNQAVASRQTTIADEDEVAFFPPVTGG